MKFVLAFIAWCFLFWLCWPLALLIPLLLPVVWLLILPFRLLALVAEALFALLKTLLFLPARLLGYRHTSLPSHG